MSLKKKNKTTLGTKYPVDFNKQRSLFIRPYMTENEYSTLMILSMKASSYKLDVYLCTPRASTIL